MHIWGKGRAAGRVGSNICRQSRFGSGQRFAGLGRVGSGPRKVTRGQLWSRTNTHMIHKWCVRDSRVARPWSMSDALEILSRVDLRFKYVTQHLPVRQYIAYMG